MACTGIEYCKLALVETKARARLIVEELEARLPEFDVPFTIHVNGCPNACARTQVADVGLKGMVQTDADGNLVELFQVHLGGGLGATPQLARKTRALKVAAADLPGLHRAAGTHLPRPPQRRRALRALGPPGRRGPPAMSAVIFHCPFCAEEDLRPVEEAGIRAWHCLACARVFSVTAAPGGQPKHIPARIAEEEAERHG
jgi:hypothetical protein